MHTHVPGSSEPLLGLPLLVLLWPASAGVGSLTVGASVSSHEPTSSEGSGASSTTGTREQQNGSINSELPFCYYSAPLIPLSNLFLQSVGPVSSFCMLMESGLHSMAMLFKTSIVVAQLHKSVQFRVHQIRTNGTGMDQCSQQKAYLYATHLKFRLADVVAKKSSAAVFSSLYVCATT